MAQFNFTTNIEKRMPNTGKVFCIDRMTSDYAQSHPFDVDAFIESVYHEFAGTEFKESREALRSVWNAVLSDMNPRGDASLYPNKNGAKRAAAMKVWHKAGDYWRRGLRIGDTLPDMVPMTKITRLDDGSWIALFPKDEHLLTDAANVQADLQSDCAEYEDLQSCIINADTQCDGIANPAERIETTTDCTDNEVCVPTTVEPIMADSPQLETFGYSSSTELEQLRAENQRLQEQIAQMANQPRPRRQRKPRKPRVERQPSALSHQPSTIEHQPSAISHQPSATLKAIGMVAAATVALFVIYETGLLIPLGLIGLATGGILK